MFLPGAPNPWSGSVVFVKAERVKTLTVNVMEALKFFRTLGKGSEAIAAACLGPGAEVLGQRGGAACGPGKTGSYRELSGPTI